MLNIICGLLTILIGLYNGDSIFYGDFSAFTLILDFAGLFLISLGTWNLLRKQRMTKLGVGKD